MRITIVLLFVLSLTYLGIDRRLFFYGKNDLKIYHPLPINVRPAYWGYDLGNIGFAFIGDFDFVVVGKGNKYNSSNLVVSEIVKYGYDKKVMSVTVVDSVGHEHLLALQSGDNSEIKVSVDAKNENNDMTWIEIKGNERYVNQMTWIRGFIRLGLFASFVIICFKLVMALKGRVPNR